MFGICNTGCIRSYEEFKKDPPRISKIKSFIDKYDWKDTEFPSHAGKIDWKKKFEENNKTIALNMLFGPYNTKQIRPAYIS